MSAWLRLLRPGDWTKNVFVLVPVIFWLPGEGRMEGARAASELVGGVAWMFAAFCLAASGFYAINDAIDARSDRMHPVKRRRPVASGAIGSVQALVAGVALVAGALACAAMVSKAAVAVLAAYAVLQVAYNLGLKRVAFLDVTCLAVGFCLRAAGGAIAIDIAISVWLLLCVFFLTLYLGFMKRQCDMVSASRDGTAWTTSAPYRGTAELDWLMGVSATMTTLMYLMYSLSGHARGIFGVRALGLALLTPLVLLVVYRFWRRAAEGRSDSPLAALIEDPLVRLGIAGFAAGAWAVLYVPGVQSVLERVLLV
jgi:decaprenyl-phosphate phosphoribosyltransferase